MRYVFILITAFFLTSCIARPAVGPNYKRIDSEEVTWLVQNINAKWRDKYALQLDDSNVYYGEGINTLRFEITTGNIMSVCSARDLLVDVVEDILEAFNRDPILIGQFTSYPLTANDLEVFINVDSFYVEYDDPFSVGWIKLWDGLVRYYAGDIKDHRMYCWHVRIEPYFKSREISRLGIAAEENYEKTRLTPKCRAVLRGFLRPMTCPAY